MLHLVYKEDKKDKIEYIFKNLNLTRDYWGGDCYEGKVILVKNIHSNYKWTNKTPIIAGSYIRILSVNNWHIKFIPDDVFQIEYFPYIIGEY